MPKLRGLAAVVRRFSSAVQLTRPGESSFNEDGMAQAVPATTSTVRAYVERPARPRDLMTLPEGDRTARACSVWSVNELRHRDVLLLPDGEQYEIRAVSPWDSIAGFWQAIGVKVQ